MTGNVFHNYDTIARPANEIEFMAWMYELVITADEMSKHYEHLVKEGKIDPKNPLNSILKRFVTSCRVNGVE